MPDFALLGSILHQAGLVRGAPQDKEAIGDGLCTPCPQCRPCCEPTWGGWGQGRHERERLPVRRLHLAVAVQPWPESWPRIQSLLRPQVSMLEAPGLQTPNASLSASTKLHLALLQLLGGHDAALALQALWPFPPVSGTRELLSPQPLAAPAAPGRLGSTAGADPTPLWGWAGMEGARPGPSWGPQGAPVFQQVTQ